MRIMSLMLVVATMFYVGCNNSIDSTTASGEIDGSEYLASSEPADAVPVGTARKTVEDEQHVTLVGVIGGSAEPFVDGLAAFTIVDPVVPHCSSDEGCPTPWDYCCTQDQVKDNIATVEIVDEAGNAVQSDAQKLIGAKELSTVVVEGTAERDEEGNLTIAANKLFVRSGE